MHHPVAKLVHQDPFTSWSYRKPRGYPGDARLLDFIYGEANVAPDISSASSLGRQIYSFTSQSAAPMAVRERRSILAELVDRVAQERNRDISVLAIASGHLREAERSRAFSERRIARWVALDQDQKSLEHIGNTFSSTTIQPFHGSVRGILSNQYELGTFDVVYAAGLYDYLSERVAKRLTEIAFKMLNPGGTLLFANFARGIHDDGYMETFMDWQLLYRDENEMADIWSGLSDGDVASRKLFTDTNKNVIYAEIEKN
jgi:hypothetical protein